MPGWALGRALAQGMSSDGVKNVCGCSRSVHECPAAPVDWGRLPVLGSANHVALWPATWAALGAVLAAGLVCREISPAAFRAQPNPKNSFLINYLFYFFSDRSAPDSGCRPLFGVVELSPGPVSELAAARRQAYWAAGTGASVVA